MRRRKNDLWDKPWVAIATVAGIVVVIIIALVFYLGSPGGQHSTGQQTPVSGSSTPTQNPTTANAPGSSPTIKELTTAAVPTTGVWVRVSYIGSYTGVYGVKGTLQKAEDSGDRVFEVQNPQGNITAVFTKDDSSTKHEILVEIYKDGTVLKFGKNSSAYGEVSISYQL